MTNTKTTFMKIEMIAICSDLISFLITSEGKNIEISHELALEIVNENKLKMWVGKHGIKFYSFN